MTYKYTDEEHRDVKRFEQKFQAHVTDSKEYRRAVHPPMYYRYQPDTAINNMEYKVEPLVAIHLPEEHFHRLMDDQTRMDSWRNEAEYAKKIMSQLRKDECVRGNNTAVQKAWEKYQMLLELAR